MAERRAALGVEGQLHERDVVEALVVAGARRPHLQQEQVLVAVIRQHLIVNFGRNPAIKHLSAPALPVAAHQT